MRWLVLTLIFFSLILFSPLAAEAAQLQLLSGAPFAVGDPLNGHSYPLATTADGRFLVFESMANNLVAGLVDFNDGTDIYVFDRDTETYDLVSRSSQHPDRSGAHLYPSDPFNLGGGTAEAGISEDGRWVAFTSPARDLVAGISFSDNSQYLQVYLFDRSSRVARLVSHTFDSSTTAGAREARLIGMSADGRFVAFDGAAENLNAGGSGNRRQVYLFDRDSGQTRLVSHSAASAGVAADGESQALELSPDGRWLLFSSSAPDLAAGQLDLPLTSDVFVYDREQDRSELISRDPAIPLSAVGGQANDLSADGRFVAFTSVGVGTVAGLADGNAGGSDCFVFDRQTGVARLASRSAPSAGTSGNDQSRCSYLAHDGSLVFFDSLATDLVAGFEDHNGVGRSDSYLFDAAGNEVTLVSHAAGQPAAGGNKFSNFGNRPEAGVSLNSLPPELDTRYAMFRSRASDLVAGATDTFQTGDLFLYDRETGSVMLISREGASLTAGGCQDYYSKAIWTANGEILFNCPRQLDSGVPTPSEVQIFAFEVANPGVRRLTRTQVQGVTTIEQAFAGTSSLLNGNGKWIGLGPLLWDLETGARHRFAFAEGAPEIPANAAVSASAASADGRFVAYDTSSTNVADVTGVDGNDEVYVYARDAAGSSLVTHAAGDPQVAGDGDSQARWMSEDGQQLVVESVAKNLVPGYFGGLTDRNVYFYDRAAGTTELISHSHASPVEGCRKQATFVALTGDRRGVLFESGSQILVPHFVDGNGSSFGSLYYHDRRSGQLFLVDHRAGVENEGSAAHADAEGSRLTADGSSVFFSSRADDLVGGQIAAPGVYKVFRWDRATRQNELLVHAPGEPARPCSGELRVGDISPDGRLVLLWGTCALVPGDDNATGDVYLYDRLKSAVTLISHPAGDPATSLGVEARGLSLSDNGRLAGYATPSGIFSYDRQTGKARALLVAYYDPQELVRSSGASFSADGKKMLLQTWEAKVAPYDSNNTGSDFFYLDLDRLLADGFESGTTSAWSQTLP